MMGAVLNCVDKVVEIIGHFDLVLNLTFIGVQYFYFDLIFDIQVNHQMHLPGQIPYLCHFSKWVS